MAPKPRFADGEKVLCFHGPLLYEAKCLKSQLRDKHLKYFIHYSGWNKNWDEWVPESRVLKYNETNLQKQKDLTGTHMKSKKSRGAKLPIKNKDSEKESPAPLTPAEKIKPKPEKRPAISPIPESFPPIENLNECKKKKKPESFFMEEIEPVKEIKINLPPLLKSFLVDDGDLITRQKKILHLPARVTVDHIIASYVKEKVSVKGLTQSMENSVVQFSSNIRDCFNVALGKMLLYKFERPQYGEMLAENPESSMCQIYGSIHLLRLITNLGKLLTDSRKQGKKMSFSLLLVDDFVGYIARNPSFFHISDYVVASPEYNRRAL